MSWILLGSVVLGAIAIGWIVWRKWIAPWGQIEQLVRRIEQGENPRTFLVDGGAQVKRTGLGLEKIFGRRVELERQVADRESGTQTILRALQDGLLVVDSERQVILINRAFREIFDLPRVATGTPLLDFLRDVTLERLIADSLRGAEPKQSELIVPGSSGERHLEINAVPMKDEAGITTGAVILIHDISQLKRVDSIRRDFVANVSHELRTPLSILRGYIETLRDHPQTSRDERARILEVMERHSRRLGLIAEDLLTLAKLESAAPELQLSSVRIDNLMLNVMRDWEKKFGQKHLKATVDLAPSLPVIQADETRLEEVLHNLLDNAVKYSRDNGEIQLRAEVRTVAGAGGRGDSSRESVAGPVYPPWRGDADKTELVLSVTDNGVGITKEDLPRIFERFYRADKARGGEPAGTGLGLAIVKHIAQLHGGHVEAESESGKGTTVRVNLPINDAVQVSSV